MNRISPNLFFLIICIVFYSKQSIAIETEKNESYDYIIGVCHLIDNRPKMKLTAYNIINPLDSVKIYFKRQGDKKFQLKGSTYISSKPKFGVITDESDGSEELDGYYAYSIKKEGYTGFDYSEFIVTGNNLKIKVKYTFNVMNRVPGGTDGYDPYNDKNLCPNGLTWRMK